MKYAELIIRKYSDDVYMVECGYHKHMITVKNCDVMNTLMLFSVLAFNKFIVRYPVDVTFWQQFLLFIKEQKGIIKDIKFDVDIFVDFCANKKNDERLFYSGGKDSTYSHWSKPNVKLIQYCVQVYKAPEIIGVETISTNFDNELYHLDKRMVDILKLELYLPIISPYQTTYLGIEKEIWGDGRGMLGYDILGWVRILERWGNVRLDSLVKKMYSYEILSTLHSVSIPFERCQSTDRGNENDFCYLCEKCFTYYIQGCNLKKHGFDATDWERVHTNMGQDISNIVEHIKTQHKKHKEFLTMDKANYFITMWRQFNEG